MVRLGKRALKEAQKLFSAPRNFESEPNISDNARPESDRNTAPYASTFVNSGHLADVRDQYQRMPLAGSSSLHENQVQSNNINHISNDLNFQNPLIPSTSSDPILNSDLSDIFGFDATFQNFDTTFEEYMNPSLSTNLVDYFCSPQDLDT